MTTKTVKSSINIKSAGGDPKKVAAMSDKGAETLFSTVYGKADGLAPRTDPKDPDRKYFGLKGRFECLGVNGEVVTSSVAFLPDAIHSRLTLWRAGLLASHGNIAFPII